MPYKVFADNDENYCVHKLGADGSKGETVPGGCHPTKAEADAHARAMWASEAKDITDATLTLLKEITEDEADSKPERAAAVLDEWKARVEAIPQEDDDEQDDSEEEDMPDEKECADCQEQEGDHEMKSKLLSKLKEIADAVSSWFKSGKAPDKDTSGMSIWKEGNVYWWMARYSNKFRDNDKPPEIISSESHRRFVRLVKEGKAPLPELWLFHKKQWKVGRAHSVAYDELGFAVAIGTFDADKGYVAEALMKSKGILVSHGMPFTSIARDTDDPTVIIEHETREISPLPAWAAANKLTGFVVLNLESKEDSMAIPDETKLEWIKTLGINPETLTSLEAANAADAAKAASEGLESKETEVSEVAQPATQDAPVSDPVETPAPVAEVPTVTLTVDALRIAVQEAVSGIVAPVMERMNTLEDGIKELKEANTAQAEVLKGTPTASLTALLGQFAQSAIGAPETRVDGRTSLAQSKPKEAAHVDAHSPIPFINEMLSKQ